MCTEVYGNEDILYSILYNFEKNQIYMWLMKMEFLVENWWNKLWHFCIMEY